MLAGFPSEEAEGEVGMKRRGSGFQMGREMEWRQLPVWCTKNKLAVTEVEKDTSVRAWSADERKEGMLGLIFTRMNGEHAMRWIDGVTLP